MSNVFCSKLIFPKLSTFVNETELLKSVKQTKTVIKMILRYVFEIDNNRFNLHCSSLPSFVSICFLSQYIILSTVHLPSAI
jgi:hypothetical protein